MGSNRCESSLDEDKAEWVDKNSNINERTRMRMWMDPYYLRRQGLSCSTNDATQSPGVVLGNPTGWMGSDARRDSKPP